jgi:hypothetical protein
LETRILVKQQQWAGEEDDQSVDVRQAESEVIAGHLWRIAEILGKLVWVARFCELHVPQRLESLYQGTVGQTCSTMSSMFTSDVSSDDKLKTASYWLALVEVPSQLEQHSCMALAHCPEHAESFGALAHVAAGEIGGARASSTFPGEHAQAPLLSSLLAEDRDVAIKNADAATLAADIAAIKAVDKIDAKIAAACCAAVTSAILRDMPALAVKMEGVHRRAVDVAEKDGFSRLKSQFADLVETQKRDFMKQALFAIRDDDPLALELSFHVFGWDKLGDEVRDTTDKKKQGALVDKGAMGGATSGAAAGAVYGFAFGPAGSAAGAVAGTVGGALAAALGGGVQDVGASMWRSDWNLLDCALSQNRKECMTKLWGWGLEPKKEKWPKNERKPSGPRKRPTLRNLYDEHSWKEGAFVGVVNISDTTYDWKIRTADSNLVTESSGFVIQVQDLRPEPR